MDFLFVSSDGKFYEDVLEQFLVLRINLTYSSSVQKCVELVRKGRTYDCFVIYLNGNAGVNFNLQSELEHLVLTHRTIFDSDPTMIIVADSGSENFAKEILRTYHHEFKLRELSREQEVQT